MESIKCCPFCGGEAVLCRNYSRRAYRYYVYVICTICDSEGKPYTTREDPIDSNWDNEACYSAVRAWNMRYIGNGIIDFDMRNTVSETADKRDVKIGFERDDE